MFLNFRKKPENFIQILWVNQVGETRSLVEVVPKFAINVITNVCLRPFQYDFLLLVLFPLGFSSKLKITLFS